MRRLSGRRKTGVRISKMPCEGDEELRAEVQTLLRQDGSLLDQPAWEAFSPLIDDPMQTMLAAGAQLGPYEIEGTLRGGPRSECERAIDRTKGRIPWLARHPCERSGCRAGGNKGSAYGTMCRTYAVKGRRRRIAVTRDVAPSDAKRIPV